MRHLTTPVYDDIRERAMRFIREELIPLEREARLGPEDPWPRPLLGQVWKRSCELGLLTAAMPEELGGPGLSTVELCLLKAEIAESGALLALHVLGELSGPPRIGSLMRFATPDQVERFFKPVMHGDKGICFAMTEPHSGSDAASIKTSAVRDGDELVINGHKHFITGSPFADIAIVICVTDPEAGPKGISAVFVDLNARGVRVDESCVPMSGQHMDADIIFDNVRVPVANVIGGFGNGLRLGMARVSFNRLLHTATMIGAARMVYKMSLDYARTRQQFGGPIARFQAIQHMLADMASSLFACESMMLHAAMKADLGEELRMEASACKLFISERCFEIADKAVQIHGNVGVTHNHPVEITFRKLRMMRILTGTSEIQRNTIAKEILQG
ncbi:acyl-CoA dehydrogenase family protein [Noviherbaspirillum galbum]|uniref:Medium-chain specific acyl-CoA dehydrogenase, mitochondrial n=1 Tax=Noviherbaspirillum galbum TaxID=2709383 RepID=A0A6B3SUD8_9BURK|nr:acyl-CoA dehydrogenase family protein [Noviherbaspirillum galbum]NEX62985.1 acyl-CoA/acyl-ACP dehydrogenase [Noviherbaspirillum galbum]